MSKLKSRCKVFNGRFCILFTDGFVLVRGLYNIMDYDLSALRLKYIFIFFSNYSVEHTHLNSVSHYSLHRTEQIRFGCVFYCSNGDNMILCKSTVRIIRHVECRLSIMISPSTEQL